MTHRTLQLHELEALARSDDDIPPEMFAAVVAALKLVNERMNDIAENYQKREAQLQQQAEALAAEEAKLAQFRALHDEIAERDAAANAEVLRNAKPLTIEQYAKLMAPVATPALCAFDPLDGSLGHTTSAVGYQLPGDDGAGELFLRVCLKPTPTDGVDMTVTDGGDPLLICEQSIPLEYLKL
jgi:hypothetical protein